MVEKRGIEPAILCATGRRCAIGPSYLIGQYVSDGLSREAHSCGKDCYEMFQPSGQWLFLAPLSI